MSRVFVENHLRAGMCALCMKHIRDHFGGTEYRCDPIGSVTVGEYTPPLAVEYIVLKGLYDSALTERDQLRSRVEALELQVRDLATLETTQMFCDECQTAKVEVTGPKTNGFERVLALATERGWRTVGAARLCPVCGPRNSPTLCSRQIYDGNKPLGSCRRANRHTGDCNPLEYVPPAPPTVTLCGWTIYMSTDRKTLRQEVGTCKLHLGHTGDCDPFAPVSF